jgi:hypothetical protein
MLALFCLDGLPSMEKQTVSETEPERGGWSREGIGPTISNYGERFPCGAMGEGSRGRRAVGLRLRDDGESVIRPYRNGF